MNLRPYIHIVILLLVQLHAVAQSDTINQIDENNRKKGHWVLFGRDRPESGYPDSLKMQEGSYINGRKEGPWIRYHKDGKTPKLKASYKNGRPYGDYSKYYESGNLMETGCFIRNKYFGTRSQYYDNNRLKSFVKFDSLGKVVDTAYYYFENGCLSAKEIHENGSPVRTLKYSENECNVLDTVIAYYVYESRCTWGRSDAKEFEYSKDTSNVVTEVNPSVHPKKTSRDSTVYSDENLCCGEKFCRTKNNNGDILFEGECKDGSVWNGKMYIYDDDGILLKIEVWKNGQYQSDGQL